MKIAVIAAAFPPARSGEADHALHLCEHLAERGLDLHVLTTQRKSLGGHRSFALHAIMPHWRWLEMPRLAKFLRACSPDAVFLIYTARDYDYSHMITFAPSVTKAIQPGARFVTQFETDLFAPQGSLVGRLARRCIELCAGQKRIDHVFGTLLAKSDEVIVLSERHRVALCSEFPHLKGKGLIIPPPPLLRVRSANHGLTREHGRVGLGVKPDEFIIAYYGYVYEEKGIETLLRAFQILQRRIAKVRLVMIGGNTEQNQNSSYYGKMRQLAIELGIAEKLIWTGEYSEDSDEASLYLRAADAAVLPFNFGVTLNRSSVAAAAAHGLPIVTTRGLAVESPFVDKQNLLLCPPRDPVSLAATVEALLKDPSLCRRLSSGALSLAENWFSWEKAVDRTIEALKI